MDSFEEMALKIAGPNEVGYTLTSIEAYIRRLTPAAPDVPEGCTIADAQMLREANHALAIESHRRAELLREWLETELDSQDEEFQPWIDDFTARVTEEIAPNAAPTEVAPEVERDAKRWQTIELLWFTGQVTLDCDDNGMFRIAYEGAETADAVWTGIDQEGAVDAAIETIEKEWYK